MFKTDIHSHNQTINDAKYELDNYISIARTRHEKILCLVIGYGSHNTSHKINTNIINLVEEYKKNKKIKDYILGNKIDIFDINYQNFKGKDFLPEEEKKKRNPGNIYIYL